MIANLFIFQAKSRSETYIKLIKEEPPEWSRGTQLSLCVFLEDNMILDTTDSPTSMEEAHFPQDYISNVFFYSSHCNKLIALRHIEIHTIFYYFYFSCFYLNSEDDQKAAYARTVFNLFSMCFLCQSGLFQLQLK